MKKTLLLVVAFTLCNLIKLFPQTSTVITTDSISSSALNTYVHYSVYLPPSYNLTDTAYPVLYLLHGVSGDHLSWISFGMKGIVDNVMKEGYKEMIIILPDGKDSYYCNDYDSRHLQYETFMVNELIPIVESRYRIDKGVGMRAIAGLSMGGYGATYHALKYHSKYSSSYSMSGVLMFLGSEVNLEPILNAKTSDELTKLPAYTMEIGTIDWLLSYNIKWHNILSAKGVPHSYIERLGNHDWAFWLVCLPKAIRFASDHFPRGGNYITSSKDNIGTTAEKLIVYPNPANNSVIVKTDAANNVSLFTITGKFVDKKTVENSEVNFNVGNLPKGVYLIIIESQNKSEVKTMVVN